MGIYIASAGCSRWELFYLRNQMQNSIRLYTFHTRMLPSGDKRIELIERMYWKGRKLSVGSVIMTIGVADVTGKRWHGAFIRLVGECFGYIN